MRTPKGTKPNAQHRTTRGRFATYEAAEVAAIVMRRDHPHLNPSIKRVGDHFTLRVDSEPK